MIQTESVEKSVVIPLTYTNHNKNYRMINNFMLQNS